MGRSCRSPRARRLAGARWCRPRTSSSPAPARARPIPTTSRRRSSSRRRSHGVDMVTVVTEAIFSYCGAEVKIDTDRHVGAERQLVRAQGEAVGHVTTGQYGSQMLALGGVNHLTGRLEARGPGDDADAARALRRRAGRALRRRGFRAVAPGGEAAGDQRHRRGAHARGMRLGHDRHVRDAVVRARGRGGRGRRPHHRRALRAPGRAATSTSRRPASRSRDGARPRAATSTSRTPAPGGAAPTSRTPSRSSTASTPTSRGRASRCS